MIRFITAARKHDIRFWSIGFWLIVWQIVSMAIGQEILLVSPAFVLKTLFQLMQTKEFWMAIWFSFQRIIKGFFLALFAGIICAGLSAKWRFIRELLAPVTQVIKATPVASFVILALVFISSKNLSVFISFLMCFPVMYTNLLQGIKHTDGLLLEMAELFQISYVKKIRYIYFTEVFPYFRSACAISLGLCWKSGVAAEVIGLPDGSIGEMLYDAKIYLDTAELFAWTLTIIIISIGFEKLFLYLIDTLAKWNGGAKHV